MISFNKFLQLFRLISIGGMLSLGTSAFAQIIEEGGGDVGGGANALTGNMEDTIPLVSIGSGAGALSHSITILGQGQISTSSESKITIDDTANNGLYSYNVILPNNARIRFQANTNNPTNSTSFSEYVKRGNTLTFSNETYTFTSRSGLVATFDEVDAELANAQTITSPDGTTLTYNYVNDELSSVRSNAGYQLKFQLNGAAGEVRAINNYVQYCNPNASQCSVASYWAKGTGATDSTTFKDAENRNYYLNTYNYNGTNQVLQYPGVASSTATYNSNGLTQTDRFGVVTNYSTSVNTMGTPNDDSDDQRTVTANLPGGGSVTTVSRIKGSLILSQNDVLGQTTSYTYNTNNQVASVTYPRGDSVQYTYDSRGNVTQVRRKSAPVSGSAADLVTSAGFPSSCTSSNYKYCNKPIWTKDAKGNQTDYTYHAASGGVATITAPSDGVNARPVTQYTYQQFSARVRNSSGGLVNSTPIWKVKTVKQFEGTSEQVTTTYNYNVNKNLTPTSMVVAGIGVSSNTTTYAYDNYGNQTQVNGPIGGTADLTATFYDKLRRPYGSIGVDPDGSGVLPRQASRTIFSNFGTAQTVTSGTTSSYTLGALNAMSAYRQQENSYTYGGTRLIRTKLKSGSTTYARQDYSYDSRGRVTCTATRMNPSNFNNTSSNACSAQSVGSFGPDRITKVSYDVASRVTQTISGYGTAAVSTQNTTYYNFGPVKYLYDGEGNRTYYRYDGFNRPWITYYPKASGAGHNTGDYMRYYYDSYGRHYRTRQRDGQLVTTTMNTIGQTTFINAPGSSEDITMSYDIAGRVMSLSKSGQALTYDYDGFGRRLSETSTNGTVSYQYDVYGRRTRMTYPGSDNFYITYNYLTAGPINTIKEKGTTLLASYTYDNRGRRKTVTRGSAANITTYSYDAVSRLTSLQNNVSGTASDQTLIFTYTPSGQVNTQVNSNPVYDPTLTSYDHDFVLNGLNQIMNQNGVGFGYDTAGNLTSANGKTYGYDYANKLKSVTAATGNGTLTYDPASRLRTVSSSGVNTRFAYDGQDMIAEYNNSNGALKTRFVHGPGTDEPLVQYDHNSPTSFTRSWFVTDQKGSITGRTNQSGVSVATNSYSYYGQPHANNTGRFQYTGQIWLEELDLYYYKARFYDPVIKRFLNTDPIGYGDGLNMYAYVGGDPMNFNDPSGLSRINCATQMVTYNEDGSVRHRSHVMRSSCGGGTGGGVGGRRGGNSGPGSGFPGFNPNGGPGLVPGYNNPGRPALGAESCDGSNSTIVDAPSDLYTQNVHSGMSNLNNMSRNGNEHVAAAFFNPRTSSFGITTPVEGTRISSPGGRVTGDVSRAGNYNVFLMHSHGNSVTSVSDRFSSGDIGLNNLVNTTENLRVAFDGGVNAYQGTLMVEPLGAVYFMPTGTLNVNSSAQEIRNAQQFVGCVPSNQ